MDYNNNTAVRVFALITVDLSLVPRTTYGTLKLAKNEP